MKRIALFFNAFLFAVVMNSVAFAAGPPRVIAVDLGAPAGTYAVVFDAGLSGNGIWVNPTATSGTSVSAIVAPASSIPPNITAAPADMFGLNTGYGQLLLSVSGATPTILNELIAINTNAPTNANTAIFSGVTGPVNEINVDLDRAVPAGTGVTFTVDMNPEPPHLVAVLGGSNPAVTGVRLILRAKLLVK